MSVRRIHHHRRPPRGPARLALALLVLGAPALPAAPALAGVPQAQRQVQRSFAAAEGTVLDLVNLAGAVALRGEPGGQVEVIATLHGESETLRDSLDVSFAEESGRIVVRGVYPVESHDTYRYPEGPANTRSEYDGRRVRIVARDTGDAVEAWIDFTIRLPHGVGARVDNLAGDVEARGVQGDLSMDTGSGDVRARDGVGRLSADTGSGDVEVTAYRGDVVVDTGSGDVTVIDVEGDLAADTGSGDVVASGVRAATISADTGSGDVDLRDVTGSIDADTGSGSVEVRDLRAGASVRADTGSGSVLLAGDLSAAEEIVVETGSGSVEIRVDPAFPMTLRLSTGSGGVDVDLPDLQVQRSRRNSFQGEVAGGGTRVFVSTGAGRIRVTRR